ncbi:MAG: hypothetical protein FD135_1900 [Comamonadaceae bacterium]|nr:MAG: hypothetical protein FD135_1900 [Comamonadaceae bacterium]
MTKFAIIPAFLRSYKTRIRIARRSVFDPQRLAQRVSLPASGFVGWLFETDIQNRLAFLVRIDPPNKASGRCQCHPALFEHGQQFTTLTQLFHGSLQRLTQILETGLDCHADGPAVVR